MRFIFWASGDVFPVGSHRQQFFVLFRANLPLFMIWLKSANCFHSQVLAEEVLRRGVLQTGMPDLPWSLERFWSRYVPVLLEHMIGTDDNDIVAKLTTT